MIWSLSEISDIIINMKPSPTKWVCLLIRLLACVQMISTSFVFSNFIKNLFVAKSSSRCLLVPKDTYFQWFNVALHCTVSLYFVKGKSRERITRSSADVDKLARSVQVTKHSTIPYVSYSFLLVWNSNICLSDIRLQKCRDLEIRVRGYSRSFKVVPFDILGMVSY